MTYLERIVSGGEANNEAIVQKLLTLSKESKLLLPTGMTVQRPTSSQQRKGYSSTYRLNLIPVTAIPNRYPTARPEQRYDLLHDAVTADHTYKQPLAFSCDSVRYFAESTADPSHATFVGANVSKIDQQLITEQIASIMERVDDYASSDGLQPVREWPSQRPFFIKLLSLKATTSEFVPIRDNLGKIAVEAITLNMPMSLQAGPLRVGLPT